MPTKTNRPCTRCRRSPAVKYGMCASCHSRKEHQRDEVRGGARERGYTAAHETRFRAVVLDRDGFVCQICGGYGDRADHHPFSRRELVDADLDPDDPQYGRTLCQSCHDTYTALNQGFARLKRR